VLAFPNCKINLGLTILGKRKDGYHNLETIFYPLPVKDVLEIIQSPVTAADVEFTQSGFTIDVNNEDNLCIKAYRLLKKDFPQLPAVKMHLHKAIPIGAGLGGGSADAAFTFQLLNKKFGLNLSAKQLISYGLQLGSDCPFFIINKPSFATGRGEILETVPLDLSASKIVIINPGIHVNTGWAFSQLQERKQQSKKPKTKSVKEIIQQPVASWKEELVNDFEEVVFEKHPEIKTIKQALYQKGAMYASMSGSGSTVYGIFSLLPVLDNIFPTHYFIRTLSGA
jgi:4-diphosphocytidyl-2-C-methyl-D-erythritol kinase